MPGAGSVRAIRDRIKSVSNAAKVTRAMELVLVARNLERVADLATNVAEEVVFIAEAKIIKHHADESAAG